MKKTLLISAAFAFAATGMAQVANLPVVKQLPSLHVKQELSKATVKESQPKKFVADGVYYTRPEGTLFRGWNKEGSGMGYSWLNMPPFVDYAFKDMTADKNGAWSINGNDASDKVDGDNSIIMYSYAAPFYGYTPTLKVGSSTYTLGDNNIYMRTKQQYGCITGADTISYKYLCDDHAADEYNGKYYSNTASWGAISDNMFGSGTTEKGAISVNAIQYFNPIAPLYIENIILKGSTSDEKQEALKNGAVLTINVRKVVEETNADGKVVRKLGDIVETLIAKAEDAFGFEESWTRNGIEIFEGGFMFTKRVNDPVFGEVQEPIVIDYPCFFEVVGFENQTDVNFGISALKADAEDATILSDAICGVKNSDGTEGSLKYNDMMVLNMGLYSMFDNVKVYDSGIFQNEPVGIDLSVVRISADGKTVNTEGQAGTTFDLRGVLFSTAISFNDAATAVANYTINDVPEWLTVQVDEETYKENGYSLMKFTAQPLPAGTTGRTARIAIQGKGVTSSAITVLQGDSNVTDGIDGVVVEDATKASNEIYNLQGQKVGKDYKGIVIKNGQKIVKK